MMLNLKTILVTTDLSEYSLAAMEYAASLRLLYGSGLYVLYVVESEREEVQGRAALADFLAKQVSMEITPAAVVRSGNPAEEIKRFAEQEHVDLVVMATHGRTGLRHVFMGSVAEKVVRLSSVPVLTVKPRPLRENVLKREDIETELHLR